jgi:hypothetical protein
MAKQLAKAVGFGKDAQWAPPKVTAVPVSALEEFSPEPDSEAMAVLLNGNGRRRGSKREDRYIGRHRAPKRREGAGV